MSERKYLPTFAELVDRLTICQLKAIHIPDKRAQYMQEMADIIFDLDGILLETKHILNGEDMRSIAAIMLTNYAIWQNESKTREGNETADPLVTLNCLRFTHSVNGSRNTAKNRLSRSMGQREDAKIDCFAADLIPAFGNWQIFDA